MALSLLLWTGLANAQPWQGQGRIAISSDGNEHDHDDWAATPFTLALLAAKGLQDKLVLYTYSDHVWGSDDEHPAGSNTTAIGARAEMRISALEGADQFGFARNRFIEAVGNPEAAYNAMRDAINASTASDPLFIIGAGPMHVIGEAINRAQLSKRQYVTLISHSTWNNNHAHGTSWTWAKIETSFKNAAGGNLKMVKIDDQNGGTGYDGMRAVKSKFDWIRTSTARNHSAYISGSWDWLYSRQETCVKNGEFDPSDAGMIIYLLTGKTKTEPSDARTIMENPVGGSLPPVSSSVSSSSVSVSSSSVGTISGACNKAYVEVESVSAKGDWQLQTSIAGYNGSGYFYWNGGNKLGAAPTESALSYTINLSESGTYRLAVRGRRDLTGVCAGAASDECNDIFVKIDNGAWIKTMVKGAWGEWVWQSQYEPGGHGVINADYQLSAGTHTIQITGRSEGVKLDAFSIALASAPRVVAPVTGCGTPISSSSSTNNSSSSVTSSSSQSGVPSDISNLQATAVSNGVLLTWSDTQGEDAYRVRRRTVGGTYANIFDVPANTTSFIDNTGASGVQYEYMVRPMLNGTAVAISNVVLATFPGGITPPTDPTIIKAVDFTNITVSGATPYYVDAARDALAINAATIANRDSWAAATTIWNGGEGIFDLTLTTLGELDGESPYRIKINGIVIGEYTNQSTNTDYALQTASFKNITLANGDIIRIESQAVTNGAIPEGTGTAYSRGRWRSLEITPAQDGPVAIPNSIDGSLGFRASVQGGQLELWAPQSGVYQIRIQNIKGQIVFNKTLNLQSGLNNLPTNLNQTGLVHLQVIGPDTFFVRNINSSN
jgi:fibronectin type 3 domain-containing protein